MGGSGIGLAIAKEIADMHDGVISVSSVFGKGATFTLSLPTAKEVFRGVSEDAATGVISDKPLYRAAAYFLGLQECEAVKSLGYSDLNDIVKEYEEAPETDVPARDKALAALLKAFGPERFADLEEELLYVEDFEEDYDGPVSGLDEEEMGESVPSAESTEAAPEASAEPVVTSETPAAEDQTAEPVQAESAVAAPSEIEAAAAEPSVSQEELLRQQFEQAQAERAALKAEAERAEKEQQLLAKAEARKLLTQPVVQISADQKPAPLHLRQNRTI